MTAVPISVVVASHGRLLRLRWLLNALDAQTLEGRFEVIVAHDPARDTEELLSGHSLAGSGVLRALPFDSAASASRKRNAAWRLATGSAIAFADEDCRPRADWLEQLLGRASTDPEAIVQGATRPDPDEIAVLRASAHARTHTVDPPQVWARTSNICYPRRMLEDLGGFDEALPRGGGAGTDLALRAVESGARLVSAPAAVVYQAVEDLSVLRRIGVGLRARHAPLIVKRHPRLRSSLSGRVWCSPEHPALVLGLAAAGLARRDPRWAVLALPWLRRGLLRQGPSVRGVARAALELPGRAAVEGAEVGALTWGSLRYRTLVL